MSNELTVVESGPIAALASAEIDIQINTARRFPRQVTQFRDEVRQLATLNADVAAECSYALPRDGKTIDGPSARFAEIVASAWGNCRFGARIVADDGRFITAQGYFHDLQKNTAVQFDVRRGITTRKGFRYSDDMVATTGNAAASIALRNAVLKGVPKALWADLWEEARKCAGGDAKSLSTRRVDALRLFNDYGIAETQVLQFLGVRGVEDIDMNHLMTLRGLVTAFREGDTTPDEVFRPKARTSDAPALMHMESIPAALDGLVKREQEKALLPVLSPPDGDSATHPQVTAADATGAAPFERPEGAAPMDSADDVVARANQLGQEAALRGDQRTLPANSNYHYKSRSAEARAFLAGYDEIAMRQGRIGAV